VVARLFGETFPWGTLIINVTGSFIIGFFAALTGPDGRVFIGSTARQFVMVGICGGYTTFSSFSLQTLNIMNDGEWFRAGGNICLSVALCLIAVWAGYMLASTVNMMKGA
jgi:CrcB protein